MNAQPPKPVSIPPQRPRLNRAGLNDLLAQHLTPDQMTVVRGLIKRELIVVGIRAYYRDDQGAAGVNDRGIYDDAILLVSPEICVAFNANTDPSRQRDGQGTGAAKGMASLKPGLWVAHRFGVHKGQYEALIQTGGKVMVSRDAASGPYDDTGFFGINIHRGGITTTSSEGCQTLPPSQWTDFIDAAHAEAKRLYGSAWRQKTIPYVLVDNAAPARFA